MTEPLVANARMYAVNPTVTALWWALFARIAVLSGVPLTVIAHAAPAPLEALWRRHDLGLAFICGYPFAGGDFPLRAVAAPVPANPICAGRPVYATDFVVSADSAFATLEETFGGRIGWTVAHSQSGFNAPRQHLLGYREAGRALYRESVGDLLTPRGVIAALLDGRIDVGPLDSYFHDLLREHEPQTAARLRVVSRTAPTPMPLLAASHAIAEQDVQALRDALLSLSRDAASAPVLAQLCLSGFAAVQAHDYASLLARAREIDQAGYAAPG